MTTTLDTNGANAMRAPTNAEVFLYAHRGAVEWPAEHVKNMDLTMLAREVERLRALSSLPAQAVGVPNGWHLVPDHPTDAMMQAGLYQASADAKWADVFSSYVDMVRIAPSPEDALLAPSQPAAVGERADALWEQLLPFMQVEECPPGDPYKDKVAALALIEAALRSTP